ncbi:hypothetical protein J4456_04615 [Candidatus Pacearchaeota archaeon]|nr:hypothetical protein [Candidatus Pacearchaeota archaeon]
MDEESLKNAFQKVKGDINFLNEEILNLKISLNSLLDSLRNVNHSYDRILGEISTIRQIIKTDPVSPTHNPTVPWEIRGLKPQNLPISSGNEGVPTDRQTNQQTDNSTHILAHKPPRSIENNLKEATEILGSLDTLKKEIRLKFKHLTHQEMTVFSTIYQLEEQIQEVTYSILSKHLRLSESSVRDYVQKIVTKGIPLKKEKLNNKKILIKISPELKQIASLATIIKLREI